MGYSLDVMRSFVGYDKGSKMNQQSPGSVDPLQFYRSLKIANYFTLVIYIINNTPLVLNIIKLQNN